MQENEANFGDGIALAEEAARTLFDTGKPRTRSEYEPRDHKEANAAVQQLAKSFDELPGTIARVLDAARDTGDLLSDDRFQGLAEIVQNADDADATCVRMQLNTNELLISHDGKPVCLHHVLGLATPWLSTKGESVSTIGRFGIGLMTLRSLSDTIEVHCHPYHIRLGEPTLSPIAPPSLPARFREEGWTTFRIPFPTGTVSLQDITKWLESWDDAALLFLSHVSRIELLTSEGVCIRELSLERSDEELVEFHGNTISYSASRLTAETSDGRSWVVYSADLQSPSGVRRARKATGHTTPISVALPLNPTQSGQIYAGLPVAPARIALFVSAQFDPLTSRRGFAYNEWNKALVPLIAELWAHAVLDLFGRDAKLAWQTVCTGESLDGESERALVQAVEEAVTDRARHWLSSRLSFHVHGKGTVNLSKLAVEACPLEGILTDSETASLAALPATLPPGSRDKTGIWRKVLEDWRQAGADLPDLVSVEHALELLRDETRSIEQTIALTATALREGLSESLAELPCVIADDGRRLVPPSEQSPHAISLNATSLAQKLDVVSTLHSIYLQENEASRTVLAWLEEYGALIDGTDNLKVVRRIAEAGRTGKTLKVPLNDEQVTALRDAFELMDPTDRRKLGPDVGRAVSLECYSYEGRRLRTIMAPPHEAYLPRRIDREPESFAVAAEQTPGIKWINDRYAELLRSSVGRRGVGAQRFLRLLGANVAPILRKHPGLERRFQSAPHRLGLRRYFNGSLEDRAAEMHKHDATYTLQDYDSPDLLAVAQNIARERRKRVRRKRAAALIATLGRAWERNLSEFADVDAAYDQYQWHTKGQVRAYWLWQASDVAWLDDESGTARRPIELRAKTPGNVAIYGSDYSAFLHKDLYQPNRRVVLRAIGVSSDPSRSELVDRLKQLRDESNEVESKIISNNLEQEAAVVYKALALDLDMPLRSELSFAQLRAEFERGAGLVLTNKGWLPPRSVLTGPPIFGDLGTFAPAVGGTDRLWQVLGLREPTPDDCLKVIHSIARKRNGPETSDETILLETMRALAIHLANENTPKPSRRRLINLALWTSEGWKRDRPVYVTNDPTLAQGLEGQVPLWKPGGDLEQFRSLLEPLRIEEIKASDAEVIKPEMALEDSDATDLFRAAIQLLREDITRNDPQLVASIKLPWNALEEFGVSIHQTLSLNVSVRYKGKSEDYITEVDAKVDATLHRVYLRDPRDLARVDKGGRALAEVFDGNPWQIALAWRAAFDKAEEGFEARRIVLAQQIDEEMKAQNERELERRTTEFRERTSRKRRSSRGRGTPVSTAGVNDRIDKAGPKAIDLGHPRTLVDPNSLKIADHRGRVEERTGVDRSKKGTSTKLVEPKPVSMAPRNRRPIPGFSSLDRETVGMELVKRVLSSDDNEIVDIRTQRNVGADAVDTLKAFYELKVNAGPEPDQVTLTRAEVQRAESEGDFFLVVVSGIEGIDARPKVRVFVDPLNQLKQTPNGSVTLSGIHSTKSLVYDFEPIAGTSLAAD